MLTTIFSIITKVMDIAIVWFMFYQLLNYSKNNFKGVNKPTSNGAWLVKNSWGSLDGPSGRDWGIDGSGYFYLSYYDQSVISAESYCFYTEEEKKAIGSTTIAQYDLLPASSYISLTEAGVDNSAKESKMANVFTAAQGNLQLDP